MNKNEYYVGLDLGTNSIGWAVTDDEYNLCKFRKKSMWGIRLFDEAETASVRREKRSGRRRLRRRKERIKLLQHLFAEEMFKVDPTFFIRLNESRLHIEDKSEINKFKYPLFLSKAEEKDYYKRYPTIYHLRNELITNDQPHDIRLVYLALHHILKNRGHFLIQSDIQENESGFQDLFKELMEILDDAFEIDADCISDDDILKIEEILKDSKIAKSVKYKKILSLFSIKSLVIQNVIKWLVGNTGNVEKFFNLESDIIDDKNLKSFSFVKDDYENKIQPGLSDILGEKIYIIDFIKRVYDMALLNYLLRDEKYFSSAQIKLYKLNAHNMNRVKYFLKKYDQKSYITLKNAKKKDFFEVAKESIKELEKYKDIDSKINDLLFDINESGLFNSLRSSSNSVIPMQIHKIELEAILNNARKYLKFLNVKDSNNLDIADKIIKIFEFRIPYYVGPLSLRHKEENANVWIERKKEGRIYPWNFEEMVDLEKCNENFINRMTNKCSILFGEDVLPKQSLLYSKYMVLNELNNLKIRNNPISLELKQAIYNDCFLKYKNVTCKKIINYLKLHNFNLSKEDLSGFDEDFKSSMKSYQDFRDILKDRILEEKTQKIVEKIIKWITICGNDYQNVKKLINKEYKGYFTDEEIDKILRLRYKDWGRFSYKLLKCINGIDKSTGENFNIINALWNTNKNFMELMSNNYTFKNEIDLVNSSNYNDNQKISYENLIKDLYISPANKRTVWQTVKILDEIVKVMGNKPKKIFIEMARGGGEKKRTISRKQHLLDLYGNIKEEWEQSIKNEISDIDQSKFNSKRLYLYYTQNCRCMYTGNPIDLEELMLGSNRWDIDHIYPKSKIKDDSIDNLVLVEREQNITKSNKVITADIRDRMKGMWYSLYKKGFISSEKYGRLMKKNDFTDEELSGFLNRQLVETRQSTKVVKDLLERLYSTHDKKDTKVICVKSGLVSDFRKKQLFKLKSRILNDLHHAKDAYLNIVVGDVYYQKFTSNPQKWVSESSENRNFNMEKVFKYDLKKNGKTIWEGYEEREENGVVVECYGGTIDKIKNIMDQNDILYTEHTYCERGALFDETYQNKNGTGKVSLKNGLEINKYGGYTRLKTACFALIEFEDKKKGFIKQILEVPIIYKENNELLIQYYKELTGSESIKIIIPTIKKNSLFLVNAYPLRIRGVNERNILLKNNMQLHLSNFEENLVHNIEKAMDRINKFKKDNVSQVTKEFDKLTHEDLNKLFCVLLEKMKNPYKGIPANQYNNLNRKYDDFKNKSSLTEKVKILYQIIQLFNCSASKHTADLKLLDMGSTIGSIKINKNTFTSGKLSIVNQSVTGLFETRKDIL